MGKQAKTLHLLDAAHEVLAAMHPMTVGQVYYQLDSRLDARRGDGMTTSSTQLQRPEEPKHDYEHQCHDPRDTNNGPLCSVGSVSEFRRIEQAHVLWLRIWLVGCVTTQAAELAMHTASVGHAACSAYPHDGYTAMPKSTTPRLGPRRKEIGT